MCSQPSGFFEVGVPTGVPAGVVAGVSEYMLPGIPRRDAALMCSGGGLEAWPWSALECVVERVRGLLVLVAVELRPRRRLSLDDGRSIEREAHGSRLGWPGGEASVAVNQPCHTGCEC